jgi:hypothetical protein
MDHDRPSPQRPSRRYRQAVLGAGNA